MAFSERANPTSASRHVAAAHLPVLTAELGQQPAQLGQAVGRRPGEPVGRPHVDTEQVGTRPHRHPRGAADDVVTARRAGDRDDDPLARLPGAGDPVRLAVGLQRLVDAVGRPHQRELAERVEVPDPEVVRERGVDLLRLVDVAVGHPPAQRLRRLVDELDLLGAAHDLVRDLLPLLDPGDLLDHVVHRLEVLDVDGRDHVDPGVEQLLDVLPALLVPAARDVGVRELVDQRHGRRPLQDRVDVHLLEAGAAVLDPPSRDDLEIADLLGGARSAVGLDVADHDIRAAVHPPATLVQHRERLADARRGAEVDAELAACHGGSLRIHEMRSSAMFNSRTLTPGSPRKPERAPVGVVVDELVHLCEREPPHPRHPRGLQPRVRDRDVRVEPRAGRGDRVHRHLRGRREPVLLAVVARPAASPP